MFGLLIKNSFSSLMQAEHSTRTIALLFTGSSPVTFQENAQEFIVSSMNDDLHLTTYILAYVYICVTSSTFRLQRTERDDALICWLYKYRTGYGENHGHANNECD